MLVQHGKNAFGRHGGDDEQRIGAGVVDVKVLRTGHRPASHLDMVLGQLVLATVVGAHVAVDIKQTQQVRLRTCPTVGQALVKLPRQPPLAHLGELGA